MGCHHGCADYLGLDISRTWIFGGTGHAFALNIHEVLCPSGPTAWKTDAVDRLAANVGYLVEGVSGHTSDRDFEAKQKIARALVTGCIDTEVPCYGWDLAVPEWYVITGYDDTGYYFSGPGADGAQMPLPSGEIARTEIGCLAVNCVVRTTPAPAEETLAGAIDFALDHAEGKHLHEGYAAGPAAFELWATALEDGTAHRFGAGYNGECWRECRQMAVEFLREAKERVGNDGQLFDDAIERYREVAETLGGVVDRVPFEHAEGGDEEETVQDQQSATLLRQAKSAEEQGLAALRRLREAL
jgi:hypothetical protein